MKNSLLFLAMVLSSASVMAQDGKATTTNTTYHRQTTVSIEISADEAKIWALLTNAADYPRWNSTIVSIDGNIALNEKIKLKSKLDEKRTFKLKVTEFEINSKLVWEDKQGKRTYTLTKNSNGTIQFTMTERIGGFMFPMYKSKIPSFDQSFEQFAHDLKIEAEKK